MTARMSPTEMNQNVYAAAVEWVERISSADATRELSAEFSAWTSKSPRHMEAFVIALQRTDRLQQLRSRDCAAPRSLGALLRPIQEAHRLVTHDVHATSRVKVAANVLSYIQLVAVGVTLLYMTYVWLIKGLPI